MEHFHYRSQDTRYQIKLISMISLAMFLFALFFKPFEVEIIEFDDHLIFLLGIAVITFLILLVFRILLPVSILKKISLDSVKISNEVILILLIWLFISIANTIYIIFVGNMEFSLSGVVKVALFSAFPSLILKLADVNKSLREQLRNFVRRNMKLEQDLARAQKKVSNPILFISDSGNDRIEILPEEVMLIKSADNYVEIFYRKDNNISRKLLRTTLKKVQLVLKESDEFIRCHRTRIVNTSYIMNITNSYRGHRLKLIDFEEEIPVSRQYIHNVKDVLNAE